MLWRQNVRHDVKKASWRQKVSNGIKNTSWSQEVCHNVKNTKNTSWLRKCDDVKKYIMMSKKNRDYIKNTSNSTSWCHNYIMISKLRHEVKSIYVIKYFLMVKLGRWGWLMRMSWKNSQKTLDTRHWIIKKITCGYTHRQTHRQ